MDDTRKAVVASYTYDPYGRVMSQTVDASFTGQPYMFATKYYYQGQGSDKGLGLSYFGYRFYSASLGRWINRDPSGESGGLNLYAAMGNNPTNFRDPMGLDASIGFFCDIPGYISGGSYDGGWGDWGWGDWGWGDWGWGGGGGSGGGGVSYGSAASSVTSYSMAMASVGLVGGTSSVGGAGGNDTANLGVSQGQTGFHMSYSNGVALGTSLADIAINYKNLPVTESGAIRFGTNIAIDKVSAVMAFMPDNSTKATIGAAASSFGLGLAIVGDSYFATGLAGYAFGTAIGDLETYGGGTVGGWWSQQVWGH